MMSPSRPIVSHSDDPHGAFPLKKITLLVEELVFLLPIIKVKYVQKLKKQNKQHYWSKDLHLNCLKFLNNA